MSAPEPGFEPGLPESKSGVLPLHYPGSCGIIPCEPGRIRTRNVSNVPGLQPGAFNQFGALTLSRNGGARTHDLLIPNQVRYQLRYIPLLADLTVPPQCLVAYKYYIPLDNSLSLYSLAISVSTK